MEHFTNDEIVNELKRILLSSQLSGSAVLAGFLSFIVNETLEGRGAILKEYTIGVGALNKPPEFNPQIDGIVRIHAGRLRRALKEYYYEEGLYDRVIISIPKGGYVPHFAARPLNARPLSIQGNVQREALPTIYYEGHPGPTILTPDFSNHSSANTRPSIAVVPFKRIGNSKLIEDFSGGLSAFLSTELTRFDSIKVISCYSGDPVSVSPSDLRKLGEELQAKYLLTGTVQLYNDQLRILLQLTLTESGYQLWARRFEKKQVQDLWLFQKSMVKKVLSTIAGRKGIITIRESNGQTENKSDIHALIYWYTQHLLHFDVETNFKAKTYYQNIIRRDPANELARAFLNEILTSESQPEMEERKKKVRV